MDGCRKLQHKCVKSSLILHGKVEFLESGTGCFLVSVVCIHLLSHIYKMCNQINVTEWSMINILSQSNTYWLIDWLILTYHGDENGCFDMSLSLTSLLLADYGFPHTVIIQTVVFGVFLLMNLSPLNADTLITWRMPHPRFMSRSTRSAPRRFEKWPAPSLCQMRWLTSAHHEIVMFRPHY